MVAPSWPRGGDEVASSRGPPVGSLKTGFDCIDLLWALPTWSLDVIRLGAPL